MANNNEGISMPGMMKNMQHIGFTDLHAVNEKIDNALSANANRIQVGLDTINNIISFVDDGDGMTRDEMFKCKLLNGQTESSAEKSNKFGIGGKVADIILTDVGKAKYVSSSKCETEKYEMTVEYDVKDLAEYIAKPPHGATKRTEEQVWDVYSSDKARSGTVQLLYSTPAIINRIIPKITSNDIDSYRYNIGCCYCKQLQAGIIIELCVGDIVYKISPIDCFKIGNIIPDNRESVIINVYKNGEEYMFCFEKTGEQFYYDFINSAKGKLVKNSAGDIAKSKYVGNLRVENAYNTDWRGQIINDLNNNKIDISKCTNKDFHEKTGGIIIERNKKQIAHFHSSQTGLSAGLIPFYQCTHHKIGFDANGTLDDLFGVMVNKSNLEQKNIHPRLFKTLEKLFAHFITNMKKKYSPQQHHNDADGTEPVNVKKTDSIGRKNNVAASSLPLVKPIINKIVPTKSNNLPDCHAEARLNNTTPPSLGVINEKVKAVSVPSVSVPVINMVAGLLLPVNAIIPVSPTFNTCISFSKSDKYIIAFHRKQIIFKTKYSGQYHITEKYYIEQRNEMGDERFMEYVKKLKDTGFFELNNTYFV